MKDFTLIVPMINAEMENIPIEFQQDNKTGLINCVRSLMNIDMSQFTAIHFILLKSDEEKWHISERIQIDLRIIGVPNIPIKFSFEDNVTSSQAETIYNEIERNNISGAIFIKDADNACSCENITPKNSVLIYPLESTPIVDPQHKSYIVVDDQNFVMNIIEKRVISGMFNCGGYSFENVNDFTNAYENIKKYESKNVHMYISNIIYWLMLYKGLKFRPIEATAYDDFEIKLNNCL